MSDAALRSKFEEALRGQIQENLGIKIVKKESKEK